MQAKQINRSALASAMGIKDAEGLAKLSQMSDDEIEGIYKEHKQLYHNIERAAEKERQSITNQPAKKGEVTKKDKPKYSKGNVLVRCDGNNNPYPKQSGEIELIELILGGRTNLGGLMEHCCLDLGWSKNKFSRSLLVISTPWHPSNNWRSMILPRINMDGEIFLHLQRSISFELKEAIQAALKEINRQEGKESPGPTPAVTLPPLPSKISDDNPYRHANLAEAAIWQILYEHLEGIDRRTLQTKAMDVTGKKKKTVSDYVSYVISPRDPEGKGRNKRAKPGYWVERLADKKLKLHILRGRNAQAR